MSLFQILTLPLAGFLFARSIFRLFRGDQPRTVLVFSAAIWLAAGVAIYRPELTIRVAAVLGIGRGADLILYVLVISYLLSLWYVYNRFRKLESQLTEIVRYLAVRDATINEEPVAAEAGDE